MLKSPLCDGDASSLATDQTETNEEDIQTTTTVAVAEEKEKESNENNADSNDNDDDQDVEMTEETVDDTDTTVIIDEEEEVEEDNVVTCTDDAEVVMQEEEDAEMGIAEKLPEGIQVKQEPMESTSELLLDEELRLQIEKSIEMVVNEFSLSSEATLDESSVAADVEQLLNDENFNEMLETSECEGSGDNDGDRETDRNDSQKVVSSSETENRNSSPVAVEETPPPPPSASAPLPVAELPSIRNDITVIPLSGGHGGAAASRRIKSEPGDSAGESCCRFKKGYDVKAGNPSAKGNDCLSLISSSKNSSLTIVPVSMPSSAGAMQVTSSNTTTSDSSTLKPSHNDSKSLEFSLTPDVTIKTVLPSACRSNVESGYTSCSQNQLMPYYEAPSFVNAPSSHYGNQYSGSSSSSRSHANYYENAGNGKQCIPTSELSLPCSSASSSASGQGSSCLYNKSNVSSYNSVPLPPPCTYSPSCYTNKPYVNELPSPSLMHHQAAPPLPPPNHHSGAGIPPSHHFNSNIAAAPIGPCNFGGFQSASSPKYAMKPPPPSLNPCRMSASPIPSSSYMRSKDPLYGNGGGPPPPPPMCNVLSDPCSAMMPPDSPSFKQSPTVAGWNATGPAGSACAVNSFRSPTSSTGFNFPPAAGGSLMHHGNGNPFPPSYSGQSMIAQNKPLQQSQSPSQHHSPYAANNYRNNYGSSVSPSQSGGGGGGGNAAAAAAAFQRSQQCCFSSQIQCFNSGCSNGAAQQQFSIVQHSTRLSNLKSNSMDSVSSLLQYHTYFKKY